MITDNGALEFETYFNNSRLNSSAQEAERRVKGLSDTTVKEGKKMDGVFDSVGKSIAMIGGTAAIGLLGKQILDTTAKFEKFGIVLKNTLGDLKGAESLEMISKFAATTPFQLDEVTGAFIKMANQGFVPTQSEMIKLGDLASSTGKSFDQLGEAVLDAQTGEFERLKDFGIKASSNGDKVTFSFREQQTTVDKTNSAIRDYILSLGELQGIQGANAKISESLTGQISNLGDKLAAMYNEIGTQNSGVLYAGLELTSSLVDNYEILGKVMIGLVATYGAYKAAVMLSNAVSVLQSEIAYQQILANIWNTGATVTLTTAEGVAAVVKSKLTAVQLALNRAILANPYAAVAVAVVALTAGLMVYLSTQKEITQIEKSKQKIQEDVKSKYGEQKDKIDMLVSTLKNEKIALNERKTALKDLQGIIPGYHASLTTEGKLINDNKTAIDEYLKSLEKEIYLQATKEEKIELTKKKRLQEKAVLEEQARYDLAVKQNRTTGVVGGGDAGIAGSVAMYDNIISAESKLKGVKKELEITVGAIAEIDKEYENVSNSITKKTADIVVQNKDFWENQKKTAQAARDALASNQTGSAEWKKQTLLIEEANRNLKAYNAKADTKDITDFNKEKREAQEKANDAEIALLRSQITDKKALIDFDLKQTIAGIEEEQKAYLEKAKKAGVSDPSISTFEARKETANKQAVQDKKAIELVDVKDEKEKIADLLAKFRDSKQKMIDLEDQYNKDIEKLNKAAAGNTDAFEKEKILRAIAERKKQFNTDKSGLAVEELIGSPDWTNLFSDLDKISTSELLRLRDKIEAEFTNLNLTPDDLEALRNKLTEVTEQTTQRNPFLALSEAIKKYKKDQSSVNTKDLFKNISGSIDGLKGIFDQVVGSLDKLGITADEGTARVLDDISGMLSGASDLAMGIATGNPLQIIQGSISLITNGIDLIAGAKDRKLERSIQRHAEEVEKLQIAYEDLEREIDKALGSDRYSSQKATIDNLKKQQVEYAAMVQAERDKKKTDAGKVQDYQAAIKSNSNAIADTINSIREEILTMDVSSAANELGNAIIDAFTAGEDAAAAWGNKVDDIVGNVIRKMLIQKLVEQPVGDIINRYMAQWVDSNGNFLGFDAVMSTAQAMGEELKGLGSGMSAAIQALPDDVKKYFTGETGTASSMSGAIKGASEESITMLSGYANAIRINQIESLTVLRNQLLTLNKIADNTSYNYNLVAILDVLKTMSANDQLRAKGM